MTAIFYSGYTDMETASFSKENAQFLSMGTQIEVNATFMCQATDYTAFLFVGVTVFIQNIRMAS